MDNSELERLRERATDFFYEGKYGSIIDTLSDDILIKYNQSDLYARRAMAHYSLKDGYQALQFADKAVDADNENFGAYLVRGNSRNLNGLFIDAIADFNRAITLNPDVSIVYNSRANAYVELGELSRAIDDYSHAISLDNKDSNTFNNRGIAFSYAGDLENAHDDFSQSIKLNPNNAKAFKNRGNIWAQKGEYNRAIADYKQAIEKDRSYAAAYYSLGTAFKELGDNDSAIKYLRNAIDVQIAPGDVWSVRAEKIIKEIQQTEEDPALKTIDLILDNLRRMLVVEKGCVTHYTSLSIAQKLILEGSKFQISEGSFLNDTSEGIELFRFLGSNFFSNDRNGVIAETFASKPFIGSFVSEDKHDDLNLWRFYGKEESKEAEGCAITIDLEEYVAAIDQLLANVRMNKGIESDKNDTRKSLDSDKGNIRFYQVVYVQSNHNQTKFQVSNFSDAKSKALNKLMLELKKEIQNYLKKSQSKDKSVLEKYLNSIAFLFKSDAYHSENELRLVLSGEEFEKQFFVIESKLRVYIELVPIQSMIKKITLGPKVDKPNQWAAYFHHKDSRPLEQRPKILISRLPYK